MAALTTEAKLVAQAGQGGRNDTLNKAAFVLGQLVAGAGLHEQLVRDRLTLAAYENGLADEDGEESVAATIASGLNGGEKHPRAVPDSPNDAFWEATDTLRHVRDFARARRVGPLGVLGVSLARVTAVVPPSVQLPPLVGGNASLNLFIGLVAESGNFKGSVERAAKDAFRLGPIYTTGVGSGEGINHLFARYDKTTKSTVMDRRSILFSVPEIDSLAALGSRNGSTLLSQLRKAWSGEALTFGYAARDKAVAVDDHSYRLSLVAGIQPGRAGTLLDDADGGTPQRFVWLPTTDPEAPDRRPIAPDPIDLRNIANGWPEMHSLRADLLDRSGTYLFTLPQEARDLVDSNALAKLRGQSTDPALDGHLLLCRMKVAVALALLHGEREVSSLMWELSGAVMQASQKTRAGVESRLAEQVEKANRARGKAEGVRAVMAEEVREDAVIKRISQNIIRTLGDLGGKANRSDVRKGLAYRDRQSFDPAVNGLVTTGVIDVTNGERGQVLVLTERRV